VCGGSRTDVAGRGPEDCLARAYADRETELAEAVRRIGPYTVVRLDSYAAASAPAGDAKPTAIIPAS
jgi:hypothetical protein